MDTSSADTERARQMVAAMAGSGLLIGVIFLLVFVFSLILYWRIASKAGYPGVASLLMLVPLVNIIAIILFAFIEWPVEKQAKGGGFGTLPPGGTPWQPGITNPPAV